MPEQDLDALFPFRDYDEPNEKMASLHRMPARLSEDVHLTNGEVIPSGSWSERLHFIIPREAFESWKNLSPLQRALTVAEIAVDGLIEIAEQCESDAPATRITGVFYGVSHLVRGKFFEKLGFTVREPNVLTRAGSHLAIRDWQREIYGIREADKMKVGKIYEFWATPQQMAAALPLLREKKDMIQGRMQGRSPASI